jgi:hypothetical protein
MPCYWYKLGGAVPIDSGGSIKVHPDSTTSYVVVMDLCGNITRDTVKVTLRPTGVVSHKSLVVSCSVYPNPAVDRVTVEGAKGCKVVVRDIVGRQVYLGALDGDKSVIDVSRFDKGVYFITVADRETGENITKRLMKE